MRELHDHKVNPANQELTIHVLDDPGQGGAHHVYNITGGRFDANPGFPDLAKVDCDESNSLYILFQNGPIKEFGVNGVTQEALLAVVIDRLRSFQEGPFRCRENAIALTHFEEGLLWLQKRTRDRMVRGVEGTNQV